MWKHRGIGKIRIQPICYFIFQNLVNTHILIFTLLFINVAPRHLAITTLSVNDFTVRIQFGNCTYALLTEWMMHKVFFTNPQKKI